MWWVSISTQGRFSETQTSPVYHSFVSIVTRRWFGLAVITPSLVVHLGFLPTPKCLIGIFMTMPLSFFLGLAAWPPPSYSFAGASADISTSNTWLLLLESLSLE